jgi:hypothetical protein
VYFVIILDEVLEASDGTCLSCGKPESQPRITKMEKTGYIEYIDTRIKAHLCLSMSGRCDKYGGQIGWVGGGIDMGIGRGPMRDRKDKR